MVVQQAPAYVRVNRTRIEDFVVGNNDGVLDAGETVESPSRAQEHRADDRDEALCDRPLGRSRGHGDRQHVDLSGPGAAAPRRTAIDVMRFSVDARRWRISTPIEFTIDVRDSTGGFWSEKFALEVHAPAARALRQYAHRYASVRQQQRHHRGGGEFAPQDRRQELRYGRRAGSRRARFDPSTATSSSWTAPPSYADIPLLGIAIRGRIRAFRA